MSDFTVISEEQQKALHAIMEEKTDLKKTVEDIHRMPHACEDGECLSPHCKGVRAAHRLAWLLKPFLVCSLFLLASCTALRSAHLDTTEWAKVQDSLFALPREQATSQLCTELGLYEPLAKAQSKIIQTNLTIRQDVAMAVCQHDEARYDKAFESLSHQLMSGNLYWPEYYSYWLYVRTAFDWHGVEEARQCVLDKISARYAMLAAPDSSIPIPETSFVKAQTSSIWTQYSDSHYFVKRFQNGEYLLVSIDTAQEPVLNLHHHPDFGYYAHWKNGRWAHAPVRYQGWNPKSLLNECQWLGVPCGPWSDAGWRLNKWAWTLHSVVTDTSLTLRYYGIEGKSMKVHTRTFNFKDSVTVTDSERWEW